MHAWTDIATTIGDLLTVATATINLAAAIKTRPSHGRRQHDRHDGSRNPDGR